MTGLFSKPDLPKPAAVPTLADPAVQAAAQAQRMAAASAAGRSQTILTSGQGDSSDAKLAKKELLGA